MRGDSHVNSDGTTIEVERMHQVIFGAVRNCDNQRHDRILFKFFYRLDSPGKEKGHSRNEKVHWRRLADSVVERSLMYALSGPVRDTPPYRAIPFRDSIADGGIAPICLVFTGYRASIAEIPLLRGVSHLHFACSSWGKRSEKGEGVSHPIGHVATPKTP